MLAIPKRQDIGASGQRFCAGMRTLDELAADQSADDVKCLALDTEPLS